MSTPAGLRFRAVMAAHADLEYALVECIDCDATTRVEESWGQSDTDLAQEFEQLGWTIRPTRCPDHAHPQEGS